MKKKIFQALWIAVRMIILTVLSDIAAMQAVTTGLSTDEGLTRFFVELVLYTTFLGKDIYGLLS